MTGEPDPLRHLSDEERSCVVRYISVLQERLGPELERVVLFGSAARGDMWDVGSPMHSDIDLLVVTRSQLSEAEAEELVNETYPLYLECGRQIGPQFRTKESLGSAAFAENVVRDGLGVWPPA
ncbi:MAG TPA: nucleotidyltransferase domain-containing protein [Gaiellales bacterium]|nr:nucleotidyltransferase domain-containing protein [Gaiellales bacterium]